MHDIIDSMQWRYATKQFNTEKKIPDADFETLLDAARLSPSSFGLVAWKMIVVADPSVRERLRIAGYDQAQFTDASHLVIFAVKTVINDETVDAFIDELAGAYGVAEETLAGYGGMVKGTLATKPEKTRFQWAARQAYIALGVMLESAALARIDSAPMEGFDPAKFDEILGLSEKGLTSVVACAIGYRSDADTSASRPKYRPAKETLIIRV